MRAAEAPGTSLNPPESEIAMLALSAGPQGTRSPLTAAHGTHEVAPWSFLPWMVLEVLPARDRAVAVLWRACTPVRCAHGRA